jgi:hypothetical protein
MKRAMRFPLSLRLASSSALLALAACSAQGPNDETSADTAALATTSIPAQIAKIARGLTGERGPFADKAYYLAGKEPDGKGCFVTMSRDDAAYVEATIYTVGSNPPAEMGFSLFASNPVQTPRVTITTTASSLHAAVGGTTVSGGADSNEIEAKFGASGGFEGLSSVRIFTDTQLSSSDTRHVESTCSALAPVVTVDRDADGPALSRRARAFYEQQHGTHLADPVSFLGCGLGDVADKIVCSFDSGKGDDAHDVPPDQLEVTFSVGSQKIGAALSATLNGE